MEHTRTIACICFAVSLTAGGAIAVVVLILRHGHHRHIDVRVETASLPRFNLDRNSGVLVYELTLGISLRNPKKGTTVWYNKLEAKALYSGTELGSVEMPPFTQSPKTTVRISPSFQGQVQVPGDSVIGVFLQEKEKASFSIDVKLHANITLNWPGSSDGQAYHGTSENSPEADCMLKVPLASNGGPPARFFATDCSVKC